MKTVARCGTIGIKSVSYTLAGAIKGFLGFLANCFEDVEMKDGKFKQIQAKHA